MDQISQMLQALTQNQATLAVFIGLSGLILIYISWKNIRHLHWFRAALSGSCGCLMLALFSLFLLVLSNLYTYKQLTHERPVASLSLTEIKPQEFQALLKFNDNNQIDKYILNGDEWQVDARILKWKYPLQWLGLDAHYQLDRIIGRYRDIEQELNSLRTVYSLRETLKVDIWPMLREHHKQLPWVDALYGSATYLPMQDGAEYEIRIGLTGLIARPLNSEAQEAQSSWK